MGDTPTIQSWSAGYGEGAAPAGSGLRGVAGSPELSAVEGAGAEGEISGLRRWWRRFPTTAMLWPCLIFLTGVGAFFRLWRLDRQAYWTDEGHTIERIEGTFNNMLAQISGQGFPPGWYAMLRWWREWEAYHLGSEGASWSMGSLRMLPAIFGALAVPAMYFLARQFAGRKTALLVMLLTAVNPYVIYYARDIKMYSPLFFFAALNSAIFFRWMTTGRHWLWFPLYAATGVAMTAMHPSAGALVGIHLIYLLTRPNPGPLDVPLWSVAAALAAWLPLWWYYDYLGVNRFISRIDAEEADRSMEWFTRYTNMSWKTLAGLPTVHIFGYLWPVYPAAQGTRDAETAADWARISGWFDLGGDFDGHLATRSYAWMAHWQWIAAIVLFGIMVAGIVPWRKWVDKARPDPERATSVTRNRLWWLAIWIVLPTAALALTWLPPESPWYDRIWMGHTPKALWEPRYLIFIVPAWLTWMGVAISRLPWMVLRTAAAVFVVGVCTVSALSNQLTYRSAPFNKHMEIALQYGGAGDINSVTMAVPAVAFQNPAESTSLMGARKVAPGSREDRQISANTVRTLRSETEVASWVRQQVNARYKTIVLTDRYGDLTEPSYMLSDASLGRILGPRWKLVHEESYKWQYEWRFYIFHTWRTRVWQRVG